MTSARRKKRGWRGERGGGVSSIFWFLLYFCLKSIVYYFFMTWGEGWWSDFLIFRVMSYVHDSKVNVTFLILEEHFIIVEEYFIIFLKLATIAKRFQVT